MQGRAKEREKKKTFKDSLFYRTGFTGEKKSHIHMGFFKSREQQQQGNAKFVGGGNATYSD